MRRAVLVSAMALAGTFAFAVGAKAQEETQPSSEEGPLAPLQRLIGGR